MQIPIIGWYNRGESGAQAGWDDIIAQEYANIFPTFRCSQGVGLMTMHCPQKNRTCAPFPPGTNSGKRERGTAGRQLKEGR